MRHFKTLGLWLASTALTMTAMAGIASADPISALNGDTTTSTGIYLGTNNGTPGTNYITYGINMPAYACTGGYAGCLNDPPPGPSLGSGYQGSNDQTWTQSTGAINQTITWGTTNGNLNPVQAGNLDDGFGGFPLDGVGNPDQANGGSLLSWGSSYSLGGGGTWDGSVPFIGVNTDSAVTGNPADTVYLYFDNPIAGFSGLFNSNGDNFTTATVSAYDATGAQIGSDSSAISVGDMGTNLGVLLGFLESSSIISMIAITDGSGVGTNFSITYLETPAAPAEVPEPITLALLGSGLVGIGLARRRRAK